MIINRVITAYRVEESWVIKEEPGIQTIFVLDEDEAKRKLAEKRSTRSATKHLAEFQRHEHIIIHLNALPCCTQVHYSEWRTLVVAVEATLHSPHLLLYALHQGAPIALRHAREENLYTGVHSHKRGRRDGVRGVLVAISKFECHLPYLFTHKVRKQTPCHTHDKQKSVEEQRGHNNVAHLCKQLIPRGLKMYYGSQINEIGNNKARKPYI